MAVNGLKNGVVTGKLKFSGTLGNRLPETRVFPPEWSFIFVLKACQLAICGMKNIIKISAFLWLLVTGLMACTRFENDELPSPVTGSIRLNNDTYLTSKNKPVQLVVLANDTITTNGMLMFRKPASGSIISDSVGFTYYPQTNFLGTDSFYYRYCTATSCDSALVTVLVSDMSPNCQVTAKPDLVSFNGPVTFSVLGNDNTCGPVTLQLTRMPGNGNAAVLPNNELQYAPQAGFNGTDSLVYEIATPDGRRARAAVTLQGVSNCLLKAMPDAVVTAMNDSVTITPGRNDSTCNAPYTLSIVTKPLYGIAQLLPGNRIAYQPGYNFVGGDVLEYEICNGNQCSRSFITIQTQPLVVNCQGNFAARNDSIPLPANSAATNFYFNVLANDTFCPSQFVSLSVIQPFPQYGTATPVMHNGVMHLNYQKSNPPGQRYTDVVFYEIRMNLNGQIVSRTARVTIVFR